jgi:hypothetical protein
MSFRLYTRDEFRARVFARDGHVCLVCGRPQAKYPLDAHHIVERKLWPDGGYYVENGASLCEEHHREAEATTLSCDRLRELAGITRFPLPPHLEAGTPYDKWGNPILPNGMRLRGELFEDAQRALAPVLALFTDRVKYPRTYHLPWSPGITDDDRVLDDLSPFVGQEVIVTAKMDGENTTLYRDYLHARSIEYERHESRSWIRAMHARIAEDIPAGWRFCGENLYAKHAIKYEHLSDYFQLFSVWNEKNECLSWDETCDWANLMVGVRLVPILYEGPWNEKLVRGLYTPTLGGDPCEGYVVRVKRALHYREFRRVVGKFVRPAHKAPQDWLRRPVERNLLESR